MSKNPGTHVRTASGPGRSLHYPSLRGGSPKRRLNADRRMYGGEKSDVTIVATKTANNAWMTTGRSRWSQGSHPRGKREAGFMPDSGPDFVNLVQMAVDSEPQSGRRCTAYGWRWVSPLPNVMRDSATCGRSRVRHRARTDLCGAPGETLGLPRCVVACVCRQNLHLSAKRLERRPQPVRDGAQVSSDEVYGGAGWHDLDAIWWAQVKEQIS